MKKKYYVPAALCLTLTLALSGCKSKEKIDLTGTHTTEAQTESQVKETLADAVSPTTQPTTEAKEETTSGTEETKKGENASSALSVRSKTATYKDGKVSIEYPILSNLREAGLEERVNALIKEKATKLLTDYEVDAAKDTVQVKCNVISLDRNKVVLTYEGSLMADGAAAPQGLFYTTTVDLNKGTLIGLSDYADAYTMAGYIVSDDCTLAKPADSKEVMDYIKSRSLEDYWEMLKTCDFSADGLTGFPTAFSYENQGTVYIAVPTVHAIGDYAIIRFSPDTK